MRPILINSLRLLLLIAPNAVIAAECAQWVAKVESVQGNVHRQAPGETLWEDIHNEDSLCSGDKIRTLKWSRATLLLGNQTVISLDQNSTLSLAAPSDNNNQWLLKLLDGISFFRSRQPQHLQIETPFVNAVHEGTEFIVSVNAEQAQITVIDGRVAAQNSHGKININTGYTGIADAKLAPRLQALTINPTDAVQWSLYYPPIIDDAKTADSTLNKALNAYQQGQIKQAIDLLEQTPPTQRLNHYATLAGLLLSVGRVDAAQALIHQIQIQDPNNSQAYALQAVIAVAKNHPQQALALAKQAVTVNPNSAVAQIALSYAHQAAFNIDAALTATLAATRLSPDNALAWARLSELQLSLGDHKAALKSAQTAQTLNPKLAKTQTILGFADLAQTDAKAAKQAFNQALALDSSDPLARLGLGLAKIRTGELEAGKTDLEIAVNLDPNNAVMRSYLGKAYYELRNKDYAGTEFKIAKDMDPNDPTPWFYDAILKQTTNRPVEALHDMQKAIELNDNRGVYRSKLLLDSDSAARSSSLGRIYNDLGFQQRGLLEGWTSVNTDPSNYSAHRLLADNYAALPRHEIARVSELLKAQLLQPVNITPVQPQAAESNLLILDGQGSSITSFNEYNPLFTRDRLALQATGYYGGNNTKSDEVVQSGIWNKFSYSLGQFHYQTDGYRSNNQQKKDIYNLFAQGEILKDTNAQFEFRRSEHGFGDINQGFFTQQFSSLTQAKENTNIIRGGLHHKFTENSDLLLSIVHREESTHGRLDVGDEFLDYAKKVDGTQYELQHIYRHDFFDLTAGMNYLTNKKGQLYFAFNDRQNPTNLDEQADHKAFYLYSNIKAIDTLVISAGFSQDFYQQSFESQSLQAELNRNPLNPKLGLIWSPTTNTTLRFAAFRSLKRGIIQKQTVEPTQIAGFNQFFDDIDGTISNRIGFGIDHKFNSQLFVGAEVSRRHLDTPFVKRDDATGLLAFNNTNWKEKNGRAYINWVPQEFISLGLAQNYEKLIRNNDYFDTTNNNSNLFTELETFRSQLFGNFYHPSGFITKINLSYIRQSGNFLNSASGFTSYQNSNFWLLDSEIGLRLPKRYGLITLGIRNLLDEKYNFQGTDFNFPGLPQGRLFYSRLTLSF